MFKGKTVRLVINLEAEFQLGKPETEPHQEGLRTRITVTVLPNPRFKAIELGVTRELLESRLQKLVQNYIAEELNIPASSLLFIRWILGPAMLFLTTAAVQKGEKE